MGGHKIVINNLLEEVYSELIHLPEQNHYSGFIFNKDNNDYLWSSCQNGYVNIWDLYNKNIVSFINTNNSINSRSNLLHIIEWNIKYITVAEAWNKSFKIIDLTINKVISEVNGIHTDNMLCIKKIYHPTYGEILLTADKDKTIKLWSL